MSYLGMDAETYASLPHNNRAGDTIAAMVLCMIFATIAVALRLYTRYFVLNKFWVDDFLAIVGLVRSRQVFLHTAKETSTASTTNKSIV